LRQDDASALRLQGEGSRGAAPSAHAHEAGAASLRLPLVSVVIINFNYGRFLRAAVESVFGQTYPNVECIVVDNASTDESCDILRAVALQWPELKIIRRASNDGQTPAALDGLAASAGPYVIFLDADDFLLPDCIETHIFVHLSLRIHAGFTSGDMLQISGNEVVLGTEHDFNRLMCSQRGIKPQAARPYQHPCGESWPPARFDRSVLGTLRFASLTQQWIWAPTSGNCFRRDALLLFADNPDLQRLRTGTDLYFCLGINAVCGSVLIDKPVAVYRLHGGNIFSKRPQLNGVLCYEPGGSGDSIARTRVALADHLVACAHRFVGRGWLALAYLWLLLRMDCRDENPGAPRWARRSRVSALFVSRYDSVSQIFGGWVIKIWLALHLVPPAVIFSLGKSSNPPPPS
jgi:glycosyltransferase involved in cell wall biosynthesis